MDRQDDLVWDVTSPDLRPVQHQVARRLKSFRLTPAPGRAGRARFPHRAVGGLGLCVIGCGREVSLDAGQLGSFSILHRPLAGSYGVDGRRVGAHEAHLIARGEPVVMEWSADRLLLVVRFAAQAATELGLEATRLRELQGAGERPVLDLRRGAGLGLGRTLDHAVGEAGRGGLLAESRTAAQAAEVLVLGALRAALREVGDDPGARPRRPRGARRGLHDGAPMRADVARRGRPGRRRGPPHAEPRPPRPAQPGRPRMGAPAPPRSGRREAFPP